MLKCKIIFLIILHSIIYANNSVEVNTNKGVINVTFQSLNKKTEQKNIIIKKVYLRNNFFNLYEKDYYSIVAKIQNISAENIVITSSSYKILPSKDFKIQNTIYSSTPFRTTTVENEPIFLKSTESYELEFDKKLYIKGLYKALYSLAEFIKFNCSYNEKGEYSPRSYNSISYKLESFFKKNLYVDLFLFSHDKTLESETRVEFFNGVTYKPSSNKLNYQDTLGYFIYKYNETNDFGYYKKETEGVYFKDSCLPMQDYYKNEEKWGRELILNNKGKHELIKIDLK